jgi:hypothetical protein
MSRPPVVALALLSLLATPLRAPAAQGTAAGAPVLRLVQRGNDIALLLVSRAGTRIALDPFDVVNPLEADLAVFTHDTHADLRTLPNVHAPRLVHVVETRTVKDVKVIGIAASHKGGPVDPARPDHVIYRVEVDGFVVALFGCLGQDRLTPEQLAALGPVDVAIVTADDGGFERLRMIDGALAKMEQLRPRAVVPTSHHADDEEALPTLSRLGKVETRPELALRREELAPGTTRIVKLAP